MSDIRGSAVVGSGGKRLGTVRELLLSPDSPTVVGFMIRPPRLLALFERPDRYAALADAGVVEVGSVVLRAKRLLSRRESQRAIGTRWDSTVIWRGMGAATADGQHLGVVRDFRFDSGSGLLTGLTLSEGAISKAALGTVDVAKEEIIGYADGAVRLASAVAGRRGSGGAAASAGRAAARATVVGEKAAKVAGKHAEKAAYGAGRAFGKLRNFVKDGWEDEQS